MKKHLLLSTALTVGMALPAHADPAIGFGLSFAFGNGNVETGVGVRVTSDNEPDEVVATVGIDYMFQSQRWRPTVGVAYLFDNAYLGVDLGFDLNGGGMDIGVGVGGINTEESKVAAEENEELTTTEYPMVTQDPNGTGYPYDDL